MNFITSIAKNSNFAFISANFWWFFFRISRQIPENSDVCRFFNQICENKSEIKILPKILNFVKIIHYFSKLFTGVLRILNGEWSRWGGEGRSFRRRGAAGGPASGIFLFEACELWGRRFISSSSFVMSPRLVGFKPQESRPGPRGSEAAAPHGRRALHLFAGGGAPQSE